MTPFYSGIKFNANVRPECNFLTLITAVSLSDHAELLHKCIMEVMPSSTVSKHYKEGLTLPLASWLSDKAIPML